MHPTAARAGHVVLSIGANQGAAVAALAGVVESFGPQVVAVSRLYRTAPWGGVEQADFFNACVIIADPADNPTEIHARTQRLEQAAGRTRELRWGPRTLDIDLIAAYDAAGVERLSDAPELTLPHPRAELRAFVLLPWLDCDPQARLAGRRLSEYLAALPAAERAGCAVVVDPGLWPYARPLEVGGDAH